MKKRIIAALLAAMLFSTSAIISFAENDADAKEKTEDEQELITTATQAEALEGAVDVDEDIRQEVQAVIPELIEEITISNPDEFMEFVNNCKLDTWSANKKVVLTEDISLLRQDFKGIPSFGGIFDGQGHTISEVNISNGLSYVGFFNHVQKDAVISNLNINGSVMPNGSNTIVGGFCGENSGLIYGCSFKGVVSGKDYIGGISGINNLSGDIKFCTSEGYISGTHFVGGMAGKNDGNIANCRNEALVNTTNTDTEITIDSMEKLNSVLNLIKNGINKDDEEASADVTVSDIGGIAGISIGIIARCINNGDVGYEHVGYNIGGIAGRQSGYLVSCSNNGNIKGRKDIGGVVGQAEPYITVDFATDVAYQLQQAVEKLHDTVSATLNDTKNQSNVISARLAVIQKFTGQAVEDTRFIAGSTIDFANNISSSTNEAFSRVEYVLDETSKKGGALDNANSAVSNIKSTAENIKKSVNDLDVGNYVKSEDEKKQYSESRAVLNSAAEQYTRLAEKAYKSYYNRYISAHKADAAYSGDTDDLLFYDSSDNVVSESGWGDGDIGTGEGSETPATWKHSISGDTFPVTGSASDSGLAAAASEDAANKSSDYAKDNYVNPIDPTHTGINPATGSYYYDEDISSATSVVLVVYKNHLSEMSDATRTDAQNAMGNLADAAGNLEAAGTQTKNIISNVAGREDIRFPQLSAEYKARTSSLADNLASMNDNFGLLNSEVNNATGVMVDDLHAVNDQFNIILNLYTDALDGVLEKDYTNIINDNSLLDAGYTTDATIDSCFNFGLCEGDIDVSGIAGTMAIEYDFDKESDITGLTDSGINTSYLTKCVLRDNRNYGEIAAQKNYAGGICGLQEMGTILNCGNYSKVESTAGSYVGGVAGSSISYILQSYAKGELEGTSFVGGIAGDGKNIRDCLTIVSIDEAPDWSGAIAGHVADNGEIRNNFFVSDVLAGLDRVSYSKKAEPISYDEVKNNKVFLEIEKETDEKQKDEKSKSKVISLSTGSDKSEEAEENYRSLPYEFSNITVNFVLKDDELENGKEKIGRISKNYGEKLTKDDYPSVRSKEGFYAVWDKDEIDELVCDVTLTASYKRYKTTLSEDDVSDEIHQSELLVDGMFREDDILTVEKTVNVTDDEVAEHLDNYETIKVTVPDDGQTTHQIRFKALNNYAELAATFGDVLGGEPVLYLVEDDGNRIELEKTGTMGSYTTYNVDGNEFVLSLGIPGAKHAAYTVLAIVIIIVIVIIVLLVLLGIIIKRHKGQVPKFLNRFIIKISERIENKEQLFYDDSKDNVSDNNETETESADGSDPEADADEVDANDGDKKED